ncbi:MAG TPA: NB-ARC domain-containing protein, partial [Bryobacteraceae bacterium]|nr:NB-ARC domain-containing protein [Bryobacteraceae bacterium]
KTPRWFLGYEPKDFVGRERYLERLRAALVEQPGVFLLCGEPGSGKSTLALKLAWKSQASFDAVVFQTCGQRSAEEIGVELAWRLKLENVRAAPPEVQLEAAQNWLRERLSLLVLDDVWNDDVGKLLPGPPVSVLATSRRRDWPWVESSGRELVESLFDRGGGGLLSDVFGRRCRGALPCGADGVCGAHGAFAVGDHRGRRDAARQR